MGAICSIETCEKKVLARSWCPMHYGRWQRSGDPQADIPAQGRIGSPHRPTDGHLVLCVECNQMLPLDDFPPRRSRCRKCYPEYRDANRRCVCLDCGASASVGAKRCRPCADLARRQAPGPDRKLITDSGYVKLKGYYDHPNATGNGYLLEHVKVISDMIGRPLLPGENVHHKNGVRDDNRPENLELWVISQPAGQRAKDLLAWAREIISRYEGHPAFEAER
jgi:hypothetical protein